MTPESLITSWLTATSKFIHSDIKQSCCLCTFCYLCILYCIVNHVARVWRRRAGVDLQTARGRAGKAASNSQPKDEKILHFNCNTTPHEEDWRIKNRTNIAWNVVSLWSGLTQDMPNAFVYIQWNGGSEHCWFTRAGKARRVCFIP